MPGGLHPHAHVDSSLLQIPIKSLCFTIAVVQFLFTILTSLFHQKSNRLKARVIIYAYSDHAWLLSPEPLVVKQLKFTRVEGASIVMKSSEVFLNISGNANLPGVGGTSARRKPLAA